jgi:hypothetical protein
VIYPDSKSTILCNLFLENDFGIAKLGADSASFETSLV